jgi:hypothetical protein
MVPLRTTHAAATRLADLGLITSVSCLRHGSFYGNGWFPLYHYLAVAAVWMVEGDNSWTDRVVRAG